VHWVEGVWAILSKSSRGDVQSGRAGLGFLGLRGRWPAENPGYGGGKKRLDSVDSIVRIELSNWLRPGFRCRKDE